MSKEESVLDYIVLLPCPFCGGRDLTVENTGVVKYILCGDCHTYGPDGVNAHEAWNTRAD